MYKGIAVKFVEILLNKLFNNNYALLLNYYYIYIYKTSSVY